MQKYIIAYDIGTGGNKASLFNTDGLCITSTFIPYDTFYPDTGWHEQRPDDWWMAVVESTHKLLSISEVNKKEIECLALSGQSLGVVPVDKKGRLLRESTPIWSDTRATKQTEQFFKNIDPDEWYLITGNGFSKECYSVFKIMWYRDNEPEIFSNIYKILGSKDYINFKLTGKFKTDYSYASGSGVYNLEKWCYDRKLIAASYLPPELFPEIVSSTSVLGGISNESSEILGLPKTVKVVCGGVDNSCMALGAGNIAEGRLYLSLGSSAWIAVSSKDPILDTKVKSFVFAHVIPKMFTSATAIFSAGNSLKWTRDSLCKNIKDEAMEKGRDPYTMMTELAQKSLAGSKKILFNPSLSGGSAAHKSADIRGAFLGLDLSHTQADIIRAVLEGIAMDLRVMLDKLEKLCQLGDEILVVGGGSKSDFWRQIFADVFNRSIVKANIDQDTATLGAAAVAAVGVGLWKDFNKIDNILVKEDVKKPDPNSVKLFNKLLPIYSSFFSYQAELAAMMKGVEL